VADFRVYFDSGLLVKLYHLEAGSQEVARRARAEPRLPLTALAGIETRNALRVLAGRKVIRPAQLEAALAMFDDDLAGGRLSRLQPDAGAVQDMAENLSARHAADTKCRTLDLLHVAMACVAGIPNFLTGDRRQADLARAAGLRTRLLTFR